MNAISTSFPFPTCIIGLKDIFVNHIPLKLGSLVIIIFKKSFFGVLHLIPVPPRCLCCLLLLYQFCFPSGHPQRIFHHMYQAILCCCTSSHTGPTANLINLDCSASPHYRILVLFREITSFPFCSMWWWLNLVLACGRFDICPQILWHSCLWVVESNSPPFKCGLSSVTHQWIECHDSNDVWLSRLSWKRHCDFLLDLSLGKFPAV